MIPQKMKLTLEEYWRFILKVSIPSVPRSVDEDSNTVVPN